MPLRHQREHLPLTLAEHLDEAGPGASGHQAGDDGRVEDALPLGNPSQGVNEHSQVGDALLQQVAHGPLMVLKQAKCIPGVEVVGQDQNSNAGVSGPDVKRSGDAFIGVRGRHLESTMATSGSYSATAS